MSPLTEVEGLYFEQIDGPEHQMRSDSRDLPLVLQILKESWAQCAWFCCWPRDVEMVISKRLRFPVLVVRAES
jgi:hypothetical protein